MLRRESQRFVRHMLRSIGGVVLPVAALLVAITAPTPAHAGVNLWTKITGGGTCPDVATIAEAASCYDAVTGPDECVVVPSMVTTPPFWTGSQWEVRLTKWVDGVWPSAGGSLSRRGGGFKTTALLPESNSTVLMVIAKQMVRRTVRLTIAA